MEARPQRHGREAVAVRGEGVDPMSESLSQHRLQGVTAVAQVASLCESLVLAAQWKLNVEPTAAPLLRELIHQVRSLGGPEVSSTIPELSVNPSLAELLVVAMLCRATLTVVVGPEALLPMRFASLGGQRGGVER
jgi:hypothetical protein